MEVKTKEVRNLEPPLLRPATGEQEIRNLICELCRIFYHKGWASGTGGGISIRAGEKIFMAPSGVQKERIHPEDIFVLDMEGNILEHASNGLKVSECKPLFMHAYKLRNAGAVLHSHSIYAMLVSWLYDTYFRISNLEMQKGIAGVGAFDTLEVPIIPNTAQEHQLSNSLKQAILDNPKTHAVLVRGHGVYIWGKDWVQAKTQAECYDYLFEAAVKLKQLGLDPMKLKSGGSQSDAEGRRQSFRAQEGERPGSRIEMRRKKS